MVRLAAFVLGLALAVAGGPSAAADDIELCDELAGDEGAPAVVPFEAIDAVPAMTACAAAVAAAPGVPRLIHQYARALERAGRVEDARRLYDWAAAEAYPPAVAAMLRLGDAPPADPGWTEAGREELGAAMAAITGTVRRFEATLPADPADPLTILHTIGTDPAAILAWVRAETRLVPYRGSLRGARGVLIDRSGNSLDRALALAALLTAAGEDVRLARTALDVTTATALLATTGRTVAVPQLPRPNEAELAAMLGDPRLPADAAAIAVAEAIARRDRIEVLLADRVPLLLPAIEAVAAPGADAADTAVQEAALDALGDHFWVQVRTGTAWRDFDPDAATVGPIEPAETFTLAELPDELRQSVTLRVIIELENEAGRREEQLLTWTAFVADLDERPITLSHIGQNLDAIDQFVTAPDAAERVLAQLDAVGAWTPVLRAGGEVIVESLFTRDGVIRPANIDAFAATGGAAGALFGEAATVLGGADQTVPEPAVPTAEWLEITINVPGAPPRTERRTLFDLVRPGARASGAEVTITAEMLRDRALQLTGATDILAFGATPTDVVVARAAVAAIAATAEGIRVVAGATIAPGFVDFRSGPRLGLSLLQFAGARLVPGGSTAIASPNVVSMHDRLALDGAGNVVRRQEFDIVFNDVFAPDGTFAARLRQGVVDTVLEDAIAGTAATINAAGLHAADLAAGRPWSLVAEGQDLRVAGFDADGATRVEADVDAGYLVLAPTTPGAGAAWWRIDPATGRTLGMLPSGGGAAFAENAYLVLEGVMNGMCFVGVGLAILAVIGEPQGGFAFGMAACLAAGGLGMAGTGLEFGFGGAVAVLTLGIGTTAAGW